MKLYVGLTMFHLLSACTIVLKNNENDSELLVEGILDVEPDIVERIRASDIFRKVYYVNQADAWKEINKLDITSDANQIDKAVKSVVEFWKKHFKYFDKIISRYKNICIWDDHFTLGMALASLKIPYVYYEESPGCHHRRDIFIDLSVKKIINKAFAPTAIHYGLRGNYPYAVSNNYDFDLNPMKRGEYDQDFSLVKNLKRIRKSNLEEFNKLKEIFASEGYFTKLKKENYIEERKNFLLIGQHYSESLYKNTNVIRYVLSMLVDYFGENMNLWIKNHPSNYFNPFQSWFPDANIINENVPMELICAENIIDIQRVASVSSSVPLVMKDNDTDIILFHNIEDGDSFESEKRFLDLNKYYIIARIIEGIWLAYDLKRLDLVGIEILSWKFLIKYNNISLPQMQYIKDINEIENHNQERTENNRCCFIDVKYLCRDINIFELLIEMGENDIAFLINMDEVNMFSNQGILNYLFPLPIEIIDKSGNSGLFGAGIPEFPLKNTAEKLHKEEYKNIRYRERQMVYMYTKSTEIPNSVLGLSIEKKLSRCGIDVVYKPHVFNYREIVLESMLEQLEHQYLKLQSENNELLMQIQECANIDKNINDVQNLDYEDELSVSAIMNQLRELNTRIAKLYSRQGLKFKIKEKWNSIVNR
ncbi:hypothetical protein AALB47_20165 [Lachnospiraceae bacterium 54-11]